MFYRNPSSCQTGHKTVKRIRLRIVKLKFHLIVIYFDICTCTNIYFCVIIMICYTLRFYNVLIKYMVIICVIQIKLKQKRVCVLKPEVKMIHI